jgi:hypothetical protein
MEVEAAVAKAAGSVAVVCALQGSQASKVRSCQVGGAGGYTGGYQQVKAGGGTGSHQAALAYIAAHAAMSYAAAAVYATAAVSACAASMQ